MSEVDWTRSMKQTFSFYKVDPKTWNDEEPIRTIKTCEVVYDQEDESGGYATITGDDLFGEFYIRIYLDVFQDFMEYHIPLGTVLVQTTFSNFDGIKKELSIDAYTPLIELKEKKPPIGFFIPDQSNIIQRSIEILRENCRAPVIDTTMNQNALFSNKGGYVSDLEETWLTYIKGFLKNSDYDILPNERGEIQFHRNLDLNSAQPVFEYSDDENSILYPAISTKQDLYGIPNVVELLYSTVSEGHMIRVINDNENSPISTVNRGREIVYRISNQEISGLTSLDDMRKYAESVLEKLSTVEYTITYQHGYNSVKIGDCVRINCKLKELSNIKAKVIKQSIKCENGCPVEETALYLVNLRR